MNVSKDIIRFVLDNRIIEIDFAKSDSGLKPTTTVLNYLRSFFGHKGVKEGCAEGDCGACTVVLGEAVDGKMQYKAVTSCLLFLPMIHGKQLITVENLSWSENGKQFLHPVQQALIDNYGSQCGYCTPGIVMAMFALYKNHFNPSREVIADALTGNLCRCTGYQSVLKAAEQACNNGGIDHFAKNEAQTISLLTQINSGNDLLEIIVAGRKYFKPGNLHQALEIRNNYPEVLIAGGASDIALLQTKKHVALMEILDISSVNELNGFHEDEQSFYFGSGLSIERLKWLSEDRLPALFNMLKVFGSLQIRNMATLGGNVASASPIGDTLPVLVACRASVCLSSLSGNREVKIENFIKGYRTTDIRQDEILTGVIIPRLSQNSIIKSYKISKRKDLDISTVSACFSLKLDNNRISDIVLAYGGVAAFTKRANKTEHFLTGKEWTRQVVEEAMKIVYYEFEPLTDARAGADTRRIMARNLLLKFFSETSNG